MAEKRAKRWPLVEATPDGRSALDLLTEITIEAAQRRAPNFDLLASRALSCAASFHASVVPDARHAELVRRSLDYVRQRRWDLAAALLKH